jgi:hypothetical protein
LTVDATLTELMISMTVTTCTLTHNICVHTASRPTVHAVSARVDAAAAVRAVVVVFSQLHRTAHSTETLAGAAANTIFNVNVQVRVM